MPTRHHPAAKLIADNLSRLEHPHNGRLVKLAGFGADSMADIRLQYAEGILHLLDQNGFDVVHRSAKAAKKRDEKEPSDFIKGVLATAAEKVAREQATK